MKWYWIALLVGIAAPWIFMARSILIGFKERGIQTGLGAWAGACVLTVPIMLFVMWLFELFIG
jgi:hypothetical protein